MTPTRPPFSESGAASIEYALAAALISLAILAGIGIVGGLVQGMFEGTAATVEGVAPD